MISQPTLQIISGLIFILGYIGIALEHKIKLNKSAIALVTGTLLWILIGSFDTSHFSEWLIETGSDIFSIIIFLLAAMSLVEILVHYRFFDVIRGKLFQLHLTERKQFVVIAVISFFLSAVIDNLTTTIVMIQIARKFFKGENMLRAAAIIVIAANAGGAFSPIGDVTTIMLWLAGKFPAGTLIAQGFLPAIVLLGVTLAIMYPRIKESDYDEETEIVATLGRSEKLVVTLVLLSFPLPLIMSFLHLPPYIGLLIGLGVVWIVVDLFKIFRPKETHLSAEIDILIKKADIPSLKFFVGILLAVSALHQLGVLDYLSHILFGATPTIPRMIIGNSALGFLSAILDNVPLTAMTIQILNTNITSIWVLLALTVGTGGSLLVIGSAAGVVAMGMVKELNFTKYFQIAFLPALIGFLSAIAVWWIQYTIFN